MKYKIYSFRNAEDIYEHNQGYKPYWDDVKMVLDSITDEMIIEKFKETCGGSCKSTSNAINILIDELMPDQRWNRQSKIFTSNKYNIWTLDFSSEKIAMEVAFNHQEAIAWNLVKPVIASELNHVKKEVQASAGIYVCATENMRKANGIDSSCGTFEKVMLHLEAMSSILTIPIMIIGLEASDRYYINTKTRELVYNGRREKIADIAEANKQKKEAIKERIKQLDNEIIIVRDKLNREIENKKLIKNQKKSMNVEDVKAKVDEIDSKIVELELQLKILRDKKIDERKSL